MARITEMRIEPSGKKIEIDKEFAINTSGLAAVNELLDEIKELSKNKHDMLRQII